jgi:hypothetical protein
LLIYYVGCSLFFAFSVGVSSKFKKYFIGFDVCRLLHIKQIQALINIVSVLPARIRRKKNINILCIFRKFKIMFTWIQTEEIVLCFYSYFFDFSSITIIFIYSLHPCKHNHEQKRIVNKIVKSEEFFLSSNICMVFI